MALFPHSAASSGLESRTPLRSAVDVLVSMTLFSLPAGGMWWLIRSLEASADAPRPSWVALGLGLAAAAAALVAMRQYRHRAELERRLELGQRAAELDQLTGLLTRDAITQRLEERLSQHQSGHLVGVLFCNVDRLRIVNDSLGHLVGDEVLKVAARRLSRLIRGDDLLGRFGGDGFVVVTTGLPTVRDLEILANRIMDSVRQPVSIDDAVSQVVNCSVGIAWTVDGDVVAGDLLRDAAAALSQAKAAGGGRLALFDETLRAQAVDRFAMETDLRQAMSDKSIEVYYQPIVQLARTEIDQFEALVRWTHPKRGVVHPAEFLPVAAESLLIVEMGEMVLHEACQSAVEWSKLAGRPLSVAVNVAERQLLDLGLVETVTRALAASGLPAEQLELEITEELVLDRFEQTLVVLRQLDLLGVKLAIDDFGTSQASLSRLKELAMVSTLKIDRSFVAGIAMDSVDAKIVAAIVALASSVGMSVVAEGVENDAQAKVLRELGVDRVQGFLYGRAGSAERVRSALAPPVEEHPDVTDEPSLAQARASSKPPKPARQHPPTMAQVSRRIEV